MPPTNSNDRALNESLLRLGEALARVGAPQRGLAVSGPGGVPLGSIDAGLPIASGLVLVAGLIVGTPWLVVPGVIAGALSFVRLRSVRRASRDPARPPHVGMGATIAGDAELEPGAVVQMGATVGSRARIGSGAVVEMGADIGANARIEPGAIVRMGVTVADDAVVEAGADVRWGASVGRGAVVGAGAVVNAGSTVVANARVAANSSIAPGATVGGRVVARTIPGLPSAAQAPDPRDARVDALCDGLERELANASPQVKEFLGSSAGTVSVLRRTCHELFARERTLRLESTPEQLARLDAEQGALQGRIAVETDERTRRSLEGAVAAIADQRTQRESLARNAVRLEAEGTRLLWTLEGMGAQLTRIRSAGLGGGAGDELGRSVAQLRDELEAIADAVEQVSDGNAGLREAGAPVDGGPASAGRLRERD